MQRTYKFTDGSSVVFTIAEIFSHSGSSFNGKGIEPDVKINLTEEQIRFNYTASAEQDLYVQAALEYIKNNEN